MSLSLSAAAASSALSTLSETIAGPSDLYESAGKLPTFTYHGQDLEAPGVFEAVVKQVSYRGEIILVCGDAKPTASSANGLNTLMQLRALQLHHVLYLSDSAASCAALRHAMPEVACVWSSRIPATKPKVGGLCVQLYWGYAFYFYDLRKHYLARMAIEMSINVLQTDTDVVWLANPYPALKRVFGNQQIIGMSDRPMINAGVFYAQNVARGDGASWVLRELARRIHTFILRPSAVKDYVPWAQPPFYANVDEQTLMNDCVRSSIANVTSFAQATAGWEVKKHRTGTVMNKSFSWKATPEYRLTQWLNRVVPRTGSKVHLPSGVPLEQLCGTPTMKSAGIAYPLHYVGSSAPPRPSALTIGPMWLFMHLPSSFSAGSIRKCRAVGNATQALAEAANPGGWNAADAERAAKPWHRRPQPFIMAHLAGVRTGAWSRRALMRAYGWWHAGADELIARQLGWNQRPNGTLVLLPHERSAMERHALVGAAVTSQARLDVLVANLLLVGVLSGRRAVLPEVPCSLGAGVAPHRGYGTRPVGARAALQAEPSCAWVPPKECWGAEYTTQLEHEREMWEGGVTSSPKAVGKAWATGRDRRLSVAAAQPSGGSERRRSARHLLGGGGKAGGGGGSECEEAGRLLVHGLTLAASRASTRNATLLVLRRRLKELACDTRPLVPVLPIANGVASGGPTLGGGAGGIGNAGGTGVKARRRLSQAALLELLARAPLMRHPLRQLHLAAGSIDAPSTDRTPTTLSNVTLARVRREATCIEALYKHASLANSAATDAQPAPATKP